MSPEHEEHGKPEKLINIFVDRQKYEVEGPTLTGLQVRQLPTPPISEDRDIFQEVPGPNDLKIADSDTVEVKNGMHFYSAPRNINPGG